VITTTFSVPGWGNISVLDERVGTIPSEIKGTKACAPRHLVPAYEGSASSFRPNCINTTTHCDAGEPAAQHIAAYTKVHVRKS
jgi:hypothetical protein